MTSRRATFITAAFAALTPFGCQLVSDLHEPSSPEAPDADVTDVAPRVDPCSDKLPDPPANGEGPSLHDPVQLVFSYYDMATLPAAEDEELCPKSGFDLDEVGCVPGPDAGPCRTACGQAPHSHGVDNVLGDEFQTLKQTRKSLPASFEPVYGLSRGKANLMLTIGKYNGHANDPNVLVSFTALVGLPLTTRPFVDAGPDSTLSPTAWNTAWDRRSLETWLVDENSVTYDFGVSALAQADGFVHDNVLVVRLPRIPVLIQGLALELERVTVTGQLRFQGERWSLVRGRLGGELRKGTLRRGIATVTESLCEPADALAALACAQADRGIGGDCDAMSVALAFTMVEGRAGPLTKPPVNATSCEPSACQ